MNARTPIQIKWIEMPAGVTVDLTSEQAAAALGIGLRQLNNLKANGLIGFYRHGSRVMYGECHLNEYRKRAEVKARRAA